jgi:hypothetical protein
MQRPARSSGHAAGSWKVARRIAGWVAPEENPAGTIYGVITVGALLAAEGAIHDTYVETVGSVAVAMSLYGFAHAYSLQLGERLLAHARLSWQALLGILTAAFAVIKGASLPLLTLLIAWAVGASQATAVTAAVWTAIVSLIALELAAGIRAHEGALALTLDVVVGVAMGLGILALKAIIG